MRKRLFSLVFAAGACFTANAQYQLANGTFDGDFVDCYPWEKGTVGTKAYGTQPNGWCMSNVPNSLAKPMASQVEGHNGKAVQLTNTAAMGNGIPAYLTLGTTWATAETRMTSTRNKDGGAFGGVAFSKHPDALKFFYKRDGQDKNDESKIYIYTWKGTWTQASVPSNTAVGVISWGSATKVNMTDRDVNILGRDYAQGGAVTKTADAELIAVGEKTITGSQTDWKECVLPLEYKSNNAPEKINIVFSAAGYISTASITDGVSLTVDDVELLYYSELKSATYNGTAITFTDGKATVETPYSEDALELTSNGQAATIEKSYDESTCVLTITVKGENISEAPDNYHVYTIQFGLKKYQENLYVTVNNETTDPQPANVEVLTHSNGNIDFTLKNFILGEGEFSVPVGNIALRNVEVAADNTFTFQGGISIEAGDDENYAEEDWLGPMLSMMGDIPLDLSGKFEGDDVLVTIDIDMSETLEQIINVHLGYDAAKLSINAEAKYGTFCAPFDVEVPGGVTAYTVKGAEESGLLTLNEVNGTIPAHTPVIVYGEPEENADLYQFGVATQGVPTGAYLKGTYESITAPNDSYVLQSHEGVVGFYKVEDVKPTVKANRCYLTVPAASNVKAFYFDQETAVEAIEALTSGNADIYDLNGRKLNKLQKGVNIVNGVKVLVK